MKIKPTNDLLFKKIFTSPENEDILKAFVQDILLMDFESLTILDPYTVDSYRLEKPDPDEPFSCQADIMAKTPKGEGIAIEFHPFNQPNLGQKTLFNSCKAYDFNYLDNLHNKIYPTLQKTYAIHILDFPLSEESNNVVDTFALKNEQDNTKIEDFFPIPTIDLTYVNLHGDDFSHYPKMKYWLQFLNGERLDEEAPAYIKKAAEFAELSNLSPEELKLTKKAAMALEKDKE